MLQQFIIEMRLIKNKYTIMKIKLQLTLLYILLFNMHGIAQQNYSHVISTSIYQDLSNPVLINGPDSIASAYYVNADFLFPAFGSYADFNVHASVPSLGAYVTRFGYLAVYENPGFQYTHVFHGYYIPNLVKISSNSSLSVQFSGSSGNRVLKFQWKNMGLRNHSDSEYVNFQIWFNEADKSVSYHYGPSTLIADVKDVAVISLFRAPNSFNSFTHATNLGGNAAIPQGLTVVNPKSFTELVGVNNFPPSGTIITFKTTTSGINENFATGVSSELSIYPNPVNDVLSLLITNPDKIISTEIFNSNGSIIYEQRKLNERNEIDFSNYPAGIYLIKLCDTENRFIFQKVIKQ